VFTVLKITPIFVVPVVVPKAPHLCLGLMALYHISKGTKSIGGIPDTVYSPFNKLST